MTIKYLSRSNLFFLVFFLLLKQSYAQVAAGDMHTLALKSDGNLWGWGGNSAYQLADGTTNIRNSPGGVATSNDWKMLSTSFSGSCLAIKKDGSLWAWGNNYNGQLGNGRHTTDGGSTTHEFIQFPTQIGTDTDWKIVVAGRYHSMAIKNDGSLWAWGKNTLAFSFSYVPVRIGTANDWKVISTNDHHVLAIKTDGSLWAWGFDFYGETGSGNTSINPQVVNFPTRIGTANDWEFVAAGFSHSAAIKSDGSLWTWGQNNLGQLGDGSTTNKGTPNRVGTGTDWKMVSLGGSHTSAVKTDGSLWVWGNADNGKLGDGTTVNKSTPTRIGTDTNWEAVSIGNNFSSATKRDGSLWTWGQNNLGQLGDGTNTDKLIPTNINFFLFTPAPNGQSSQTVCDQSTLSALSVNGTAIRWYETATGGQALSSTTRLENNRTYYASQILNGLESTTRFGVTVTLSIPTASITASGPTAFCFAVDVTLTANSGSAYLWSNGATTRSIRVNTPGSYTVTVTNANGCSVTSTATEVTLWPMATITASGPTTFCQGLGNKVILTANEGTAYLWSNGATTRSIEVFNSGNHWVDVTNSNGCTTRAFITTTVTVDNSLSATISASGSTTICQGGKVTLTASEGSSYLWNTGATTRSIEASTGGNYTVWVTNANGCSVRSPATLVSVTQLPNLFISPSGPTTFCAGDAVMLTASTDGSYLWSNGATTKSINASSSGNYTVTVTYANGCSATSAAIAVTATQVVATITASGSTNLCQGGKVTLTASEGSAYLWSNGATTRSIEVTSAGNYTVRVTNANGCSATSSATAVTVNPLPTATIATSGSTTFCQGGKVTLTASVGSAYLWSNGATTRSIEVSTAGNYTVTVTNANGCSATSAATSVTVNPLPAATITAGGPTIITQTGTVVLSANSGTGFTYQWYKDGTAISAATARTYTATAAGSYTVKVSNAAFCETLSTATQVKTVFVLPSTNYQLTVSSETCRTSDNGKVSISAVQNLSYTATLSRAGQTVKTANFTTTTELTGLSAGNYSLCITVAGQAEYKQCYDITITEPQDLSVYSAVNLVTNTLELSMSGSDTYSITHNGKTYTSNSASMSLALQPGLNKISVRAAQVCQGEYTEEIYLDEQVTLYPNPFSGTLNIKVENQEGKELIIKVLNGAGATVHQAKHPVNNNLISLDLSKLENGYYVVVVANHTYKVIKK